MTKRRITTNKVRGGLYKSARVLGDIQALGSGDPTKVAKRIGRRVTGKATGRVLGRLFK